MSTTNASKFVSNMGSNAPFFKALKEWNAKRKLKSWCVPAKGTEEYNEVIKIMNARHTMAAKKNIKKVEKEDDDLVSAMSNLNIKSGKGIKMITKKKK